MTAPMSLRGLARLMGVSDMAVRKACKAGVFSPESVTRDDVGKWVVLDVTLAIREWEQSGRQLRGSPRRAVVSAATPASQQPSTADDQAPDTREELGALLARVRELRKGVPPAPAGTVAPGVDDDLLNPTGEAPPVDSSLVAAQRIAMVERGRKLKLENDEREGLLIETSKASREGFEFARAVRENVLNVPARLAAELAAESDGARVFARLDAALREALEATASRLEAMPVD